MRLLITILAWSAALAAECILVEEEFIRVSDVPRAAELGLPLEDILLRSPTAGSRRSIEGAELRRLLRLPENAPLWPPVCFEQVTESLSPQRIIEAMQSAFPGRTVTIRISDYSRYPVPKGRLEFTRAGLFATAATPPGRVVLWRGRIVSASGKTTPVWARIVVEATRDVLTCGRTLDPGMRIELADLALASKAAFPSDEGKALQPAEAAGMTVRRRVSAGSEITRPMLVEPYDVEARQTVTLEVRADAVRLKITAIAEGRGRTGESIWLKQTPTGRRIRARVTGTRTAILEINPASGEKANNDLDELHSGRDPALGRMQP